MAPKSSHSHAGSKGKRKIHKVMKDHKARHAQVWQW